MEKKSVIIGMSGGVDSSVSAYLLQQEGYQVYGVHMLTKPLDQTRSSGLEDAQKVCDKLGIELIVMDERQQFKDKVINYFVDEYQNGRTPNPCVVCNRNIKWEMLLFNQDKIKVDYVATGHYANIVKLDNNRYALKNAKTATKDQTYMLYNLRQDQLEHTLFPLANYEKDQVRLIAEEIGLEIAHKKDSQEICFIDNDDYIDYLQNNQKVTMKPGDFIDEDGNVLGKHSGIIKYTIGQRKGLEVNLNKKMFVTKIDPKNNTITLGDSSDLYTDTCFFNHVNMMGLAEIDEPLNCVVKCRYSQVVSEATITKEGDDLYKCVFKEKQRAITPGQSLVFYKDGCILGGGQIK